MILTKKILWAARATVDAAPPTVNAVKWHPVGATAFVLINAKVSGTTSVVWELWLLTETHDASNTFIAVDRTHNASGQQTTLQGTNGDVLMFDVRGADAYYLRPVTRTAGDESFDAMASHWRAEKF